MCVYARVCFRVLILYIADRILESEEFKKALQPRKHRHKHKLDQPAVNKVMLQQAVDQLLKGPAPIVPNLRGRRSRFPAGVVFGADDESAAALRDALSSAGSQVQFAAMESKWGAFCVRSEGKRGPRKRSAPASASDAAEPQNRRRRVDAGPARSAAASSRDRDGTHQQFRDVDFDFLQATTMTLSGCLQAGFLSSTTTVQRLVMGRARAKERRATRGRARARAMSTFTASPWCFRQRPSTAEAAAKSWRAAKTLGNAPPASVLCTLLVAVSVGHAGMRSDVLTAAEFACMYELVDGL